MKILLSPAKTFAKEIPEGIPTSTPLFETETAALVNALQNWQPEDFKDHMHVSENIAHLNHQRYQVWEEQASFPALAYFKGDVYRGLAVEDFDNQDWDYAQTHVNIISGLYGILRARDRIKNYRLEMGTKWAPEHKNLYEFWSTKISDAINQVESEYVINLASNEYWKAVDQSVLKAPVITPIFKQYKDEKLKIIAIHAKRARGLMTRYAVKNNITDPEELKNFDLEDYRFDSSLSTDREWVFVR